MNILSNQEILDLIKKFPAHYTQQIKRYHEDTFEFITSTYICTISNKFSEKLYQHIYQEFGKCKGDNCNNQCKFKEFNTGYRQFCCSKCKDSSIWMKYRISQSKLEKFGDPAYNNREKFKQTMLQKPQDELDRINDLKTKRTREVFKLHGTEIINKAKETKLIKYGDENYNNREQTNQTKIERYNDVNYNNVEKRKQTNLDRFGSDWYVQTEEFKKSAKVTKQARYENGNFDLEKFYATNRKNYGYNHPMQDPNILKSRMKACFKLKEYILPSGRIVEVRGYEPFALDTLFESYKEHQITTDHNEMPQFWYVNEGSNHRYFPDIFIKSENNFIEVKSQFTYDFDKDKIQLKCNSVKSLGYSIEVWIINPKKKTIQKIQY